VKSENDPRLVLTVHVPSSPADVPLEAEAADEPDAADAPEAAGEPDALDELEAPAEVEGSAADEDGGADAAAANEADGIGTFPMLTGAGPDGRKKRYQRPNVPPISAPTSTTIPIQKMGRERRDCGDVIAGGSPSCSLHGSLMIISRCAARAI
jgi:hypothetical protein